MKENLLGNWVVAFISNLTFLKTFRLIFIIELKRKRREYMFFTRQPENYTARRNEKFKGNLKLLK